MRLAGIVAGCVLLGMGGCERSGGSSNQHPTPARAPAPAEPAPLPATIEMGERRVGAYVVRASRDQGECYPGANLPCTVVVTPDPGAAAITAVTFWIGYEDPARAFSSVVEAVATEGDPSAWFAVTTIPAPYPDGGEFWVRIQDEQAGSATGYFKLIQ